MVTQPTSHPHQALSSLLDRGLLWNGEGVTATTFEEPCATSKALPFGLPEIDDSLPLQGLQRGAIHEMFYNDPLQPLSLPRCIPARLASNAHNALVTTQRSWDRATPLARIIWIGKRCWPTPYAMSLVTDESHAASTLVSDSLFIDPPNEKLTLWAIETALRSPAVDLVIAACPRISLVTTKRLSIAAHTHGATALLLRHADDASMPSCAATKWLVTPTPSPLDIPAWELSLTKIKGNSVDTASWLIGLYEENSNVSLRVLPRMVDSGHEEKAPRERYGT